MYPYIVRLFHLITLKALFFPIFAYPRAMAAVRVRAGALKNAS